MSVNRIPAGSGSYTDEQVRDVMGTALVAGTNVTITPDDGADTITIAAAGGGYTDEQVDDRVNALLVAGANITKTYDDTANTLTIAATGGGSGYATVQDEGTARTQRAILNFAGAGVTATDDAGGSRTLVTIPGGTGAASNLYITPEDHGAVAGSADNSTALQAAINAARTTNKVLLINRGYSHASTLTIAGPLQMRGADMNTTLTYTGTGTAIANVNPAARTYRIHMSDLYISTSTGAIGMELGWISSSVFERMTVVGFSNIGIRMISTDGESVYNTFIAVTAQSSPTGFQIGPGGSNSNQFYGCRSNVCTTDGMRIVNANQNQLTNCQFESGGVGVRITATSNALSDGNVLLGNRFENNTVNNCVIDTSFVRDTSLVFNQQFTNTHVDSGSRTWILDAFEGATTRPFTYTTALRPSASGARAGAMVYDTTLGKPIFSNGSVWKDAAGTTV